MLTAFSVDFEGWEYPTITASVEELHEYYREAIESDVVASDEPMELDVGCGHPGPTPTR